MIIVKQNNRNFAKIVLTIFALSLVFSACKGPKIAGKTEKDLVQNGFKKVSSEEKGFDLLVPEDWETGEFYMGQLDLIYMAPSDNAIDNFGENMNVVIEFVDTLSLKTYSELALPMLPEFLNNAEILEQEILQENKSEFIRTIYTHELSIHELKVSTFIHIHNKFAYVITCTAEEDVYEKYQEKFEVIGRSIQFNK